MVALSSALQRGIRASSAGILLASHLIAGPNPANRLACLDEDNPFHPHRDFPKLTTPQWVGEPGVEAVVLLSIDDLREPEKYESFLRPVLDRLKQIDGRAPVTIFCNAHDPAHPQLAAWLREGLSLEVHTLAHPCPCLAKGDFAAADRTYHGCVDLLHRIPGNTPVAFRMPCCDSMNSASPRFYAEIFNRVSPEGRFLTMDSSVMNVFTTNDASLPRATILDDAGQWRFGKYFPAATNALTRVSLKSFTTTIEDYPYPYVLGKLGWELPMAAPSDWNAHNAIGSTNPVMLADWKATLDATVLKRGVMTIVSHPHGWSSARQFVELIDHAVSRHGRKVKFLNFREVQERLDRHLLLGNPLRDRRGADNGVRLLDLNDDGYMDVVLGNEALRRTRLWQPDTAQWRDSGFPTTAQGTRFGVMTNGDRAEVVMVQRTESASGGWRFDGRDWVGDASLLRGLETGGQPVLTLAGGRDRGVRLRDVDGDGNCELLVGNEAQRAVFGWHAAEKTWRKLAFSLPPDTAFVDGEGRDAGLRFVDVNEDGHEDVLFSNAERCSLHLFIPKANKRLMWEVGWNDAVFAGARSDSSFNLPGIVRAGTNRNNGAWFARNTLWVQNEDTAHLPDRVDRRSFRELLNADTPAPLTPEQSLAAMRPRPGFTVELVAAEPLLRSPVAFDWGADGRLWVVEMGDYPSGLDGQGKPGGAVKVLEDLDGDGRYDKATTFLDELKYPTSVFPWRGGAILAAAPEIFFAEDTDGDGRADRRRALFTGFTEGNPQHLLNGFELGLDNWIYGANGDSGGQVASANPAARMAPVDIRHRDFRFRPDDGRFEAIGGQTQYGLHRDDWGNWFGNNNPTWLWHYHLPDRYVARNPHLLVRDNKRVLARYADGTRVFPASRTRQRFNDHHQFNHVTSANSPTPYRDDLFGPEFATSVFISEPVHNLVHREVLEPEGLSFRSGRASGEAATEFLASVDPFFRPTMLRTGPDGALYVADFYRHVLEHPEWIPDFLETRLDLRAGADLGRIYRVFPNGVKLRKIPRLDKLDSAGLVAALDSPNGWQRDTAQRLLVERADKSAARALAGLVASSPNPKARLQALATLEGLGTLTPAILMKSLQDAHPGVREFAVRLSESVGAWKEGDFAALTGALTALADDAAVRVRGQLAFTLGEISHPRAGAALVKIALRDSDDAHLQTAVMTSAPRHLRGMVEALATRPELDPAGRTLAGKLLALAVALDETPAMADALGLVIARRTDPPEPWQFTALGGFLEALERRGVSFAKLAADAPGELKAGLARVSALTDAARQVAANPDAAEAARLAALPLLGRESAAGRQDDFTLLGRLLGARETAAVQRGALAALGRSADGRAARQLLGAWNTASPALRGEILNALLGRPAWTKLLVAELEAGRFARADVAPAFQQKLLDHGDAGVRSRAGKVFAATVSDRAAVLGEYEGVTRLTGDPARGAAFFQQQCAVCHRLRGEGREVGPDLGALANKSTPALLAAILDPHQAVEWRYVTYTARTKDDREISGILATETAASVTLRTAAGTEEVLLRSQIEDLRSSKLSLMPEGLEKALPPQAMADLLAWLTGP